MGLFVTEPAGRLPVSSMGGFLGSGKTTLLDRLLRHPGMADTAGAMNKLGEVGLDQAVIEHVDGIVVMAKGCRCRTVRSDLENTALNLFTRRGRGEVPDCDRVPIEAAGALLPGTDLPDRARQSDDAAPPRCRCGDRRGGRDVRGWAVQRRERDHRSAKPARRSGGEPAHSGRGERAPSPPVRNLVRRPMRTP